MATRHKAIKATLDVGAASEWNDDHIADFTDEITLYEDFITPAITTKWDVTANAAGVVGVITFVDHHSCAFLNSGAAQLDWSLMKYEFNGAPGNMTHAADAPIFTSAVWLNKYDLVNIIGEWGLMNNAVAPTLANKDGAYFRVDANLLYAVTGDGAAETTTNLGAPPEYGAYKIKLQSAHCYFYIDDIETAIADHTNNLPDSDLTIKLSARNVGGNQVVLRTDAVGLKRLRYKG